MSDVLVPVFAATQLPFGVVCMYRHDTFNANSASGLFDSCPEAAGCAHIVARSVGMARVEAHAKGRSKPSHVDNCAQFGERSADLVPAPAMFSGIGAHGRPLTRKRSMAEAMRAAPASTPLPRWLLGASLPALLQDIGADKLVCEGIYRKLISVILGLATLIRCSRVSRRGVFPTPDNRTEGGCVIGIDGLGLECARIAAEYLECVATEFASAAACATPPDMERCIPNPAM